MPQNDTVRVIRVLEYIGPRDWIEKGLAARYVKGSFILDGIQARITELVLTYECLDEGTPLNKPDPAQGAGVSDSPPQP
jgi:hypothetical protein